MVKNDKVFCRKEENDCLYIRIGNHHLLIAIAMLLKGYFLMLTNLLIINGFSIKSFIMAIIFIYITLTAFIDIIILLETKRGHI